MGTKAVPFTATCRRRVNIYWLVLLLTLSTRDSVFGFLLSPAPHPTRHGGLTLRETPIPLRDLLDQLDARSIPYPPTATRTDLEELLKNDNNNSLSDTVPPERWEKRKRRQRQHKRHATQSTLSSVVNGSYQTLSTLSDKSYRKARNWKRRLSRWYRTDPDSGVRNASFTKEILKETRPNVVVATNVEVITEPLVRPRKRRRPVASNETARPSRRPTPPTATRVDASPPRAPKQSPNQTKRQVATRQNQQNYSVRNEMASHAPPTSQHNHGPNGARSKQPVPKEDDVPTAKATMMKDSLQQPTLVIPPLPTSEVVPSAATTKKPITKRQRLEAKRPRGKPLKPRPIYSPYQTPTKKDQPDDLYRDSFDRLGDLIANAADTVLWGPLYDDADNDNKSKEEVSTHRPKHHDEASTHQPKRHGPHWKDHLEEQLDTMLGVREGDAFYDRWTKQFERDGPDGPDNVIVKRQKRPATTPSFWEHNAGLSELFFGRSNNRKDDLLRDWEKGSIVSVLRLLMLYTCRVGGYLCRWASTKHTIPQPVVVFVVTSIGLSVRRRRLLSMGLALLVLRTIGELLHGYAEDMWEENWEGLEDDEASLTEET